MSKKNYSSFKKFEFLKLKQINLLVNTNGVGGGVGTGNEQILNSDN